MTSLNLGVLINGNVYGFFIINVIWKAFNRWGWSNFNKKYKRPNNSKLLQCLQKCVPVSFDTF